MLWHSWDFTCADFFAYHFFSIKVQFPFISMLKSADGQLSKIALVCASGAANSFNEWISYLHQAPDFIVFSCSHQGQDLLSYCRRLAPCVLIMDQVCFTALDEAKLSGMIGSAGPIRALIVPGDDAPVLCEEYLSRG